MGHGPARELARAEDKEVELNAELSARLDVALARLDKLDARFRAAREEERFAQNTKIWNRLCAEIDGHLRTMAKVLFTSHQLNLDIGSDGGGMKARPWMEEMGQTFERLWFKLDGGQVVASSGARTIATAKLKEITYAWVERAVVDWVVGSAEQKR